MKKLFVLFVVVVLSLMIVSVAVADTPAPGGPFSTAFRVQNIDTGDVTCSYQFYDSSGNQKYDSGVSSPISPGDALFVYVPNLGGLNSGTYSGVVGCSGKVAAVTNYSDSDSAASFNGIGDPQNTWYAPGIYDNYYGYYSDIVVQNATGGPLDITVEIFAPGSATPVTTQNANNVPAYASANFEQEGLGSLSANVPYSAKISAGGNIAPVVNVYGSGGTAPELYSYNPFLSGSTKMYAPVVMYNYYGYNSALVVQNLGSVPTKVTVDYTTNVGTKTQSSTVAAGSAWSIYVPSQGPAGIPSGNTNGLFSAIVTSTGTGGNPAQDVAVLVNESNSYNRAASFVGFDAGSGDVRIPVVLKRYYNYNSSVTCQVLSGGPATMTIKYYGTSGLLGSTASPSVGNGGTALFYQPNAGFLPNNWVGSATVESAAQIACVVNQDMNEGSYATTKMDQLLAYEGIAP